MYIATNGNDKTINDFVMIRRKSEEKSLLSNTQYVVILHHVLKKTFSAFHSVLMIYATSIRYMDMLQSFLYSNVDAQIRRER